MIKESTQHLNNIEVVHFSNLTVDFAKKVGAKFIIRGLRAVSDFEFELQMALMNHQLNPDIETIFLASATQFIFLSSKIIKEVLQFNADISEMVPACVEKRLREKYHQLSLYTNSHDYHI